MERFKGKALPLKAVIQEIIQKSDWSDTYLEHKLKIVWLNIAGQLIARYTTSIYIKKEILHIQVSNASLKAELHQNKTLWLARIQAEMGEAASSIQEIKIK